VTTLRDFCMELKAAIDDEKKAFEADYPKLHGEAKDLGFHDLARKIKRIQADETKHHTTLRDFYLAKCPRSMQTEL